MPSEQTSLLTGILFMGERAASSQPENKLSQGGVFNRLKAQIHFRVSAFLCRKWQELKITSQAAVHTLGAEKNKTSWSKSRGNFLDFLKKQIVNFLPRIGTSVCVLSPPSTRFSFQWLMQLRFLSVSMLPYLISGELKSRRNIQMTDF